MILFLDFDGVLHNENVTLKHCHGHIHSQWLVKKEDGMPPMIKVGIDMWDLRPISEVAISEKFQEL